MGNKVNVPDTHYSYHAEYKNGKPVYEKTNSNVDCDVYKRLLNGYIKLKQLKDIFVNIDRCNDNESTRKFVSVFLEVVNDSDDHEETIIKLIEYCIKTLHLGQSYYNYYLFLSVFISFDRKINKATYQDSEVKAAVRELESKAAQHPAVSDEAKSKYVKYFRENLQS